jgi:hypothetical protein
MDGDKPSINKESLEAKSLETIAIANFTKGSFNF